MNLDDYDRVLAATHGSVFHAPAGGPDAEERKVDCDADAPHDWKWRNAARVLDWRRPCKACFGDDPYQNAENGAQNAIEVSD